jgi:hypothetical protein
MRLEPIGGQVVGCTKAKRKIEDMETKPEWCPLEELNKAPVLSQQEIIKAQRECFESNSSFDNNEIVRSILRKQVEVCHEYYMKVIEQVKRETALDLCWIDEDCHTAGLILTGNKLYKKLTREYGVE